jgi:hypothetical protein
VDDVERLFGLRQWEPRPKRGCVREEQDVALDDLWRVHAGKWTAAQQRGDFGGAPDHHDRLGAEGALQPSTRAGYDRLHALGRRVEQDVAAGDERADVAAAGPREGVRERALRHESAPAHVHGTDQCHVALVVRPVRGHV